MRKAAGRAMVAALCGALPVLSSTSALAQGYPTKPIRYIVPFAPSGTGDVCARLHAQLLQERLGQPVVVDNRPGASQAIGLETAVKSAPDGYTMVQATLSGIVLNTVFRSMGGKPLPYDPVADLAPVSMVCTAPLLLASHASIPAKTVKEFVAYARTRPGKLTYGSTGVGSTMHLATALFASQMNIEMLHVPYKSGAQATLDMVTGVIDVYFGGALLLPHAKAGKVNILATGGMKRTRASADVPTMHESGVTGFDVSSWFGFAVPAAVPRPIVDRLHRETVAALSDTGKLGSKANDIEYQSSSPQQLAERIQREMQLWTKVMRNAGIKPDK